MDAGLFVKFPQTKLIHADVDPSELGRNYPPDIAVVADARTFLRQLLAEVDTRKPKREATKAWIADIRKWQSGIGTILCGRISRRMRHRSDRGRIVAIVGRAAAGRYPLL